MKPEVELSQYGELTPAGPRFRNTPRWDIEGRLSLIEGRVTPDVAARLVRRRPWRPGDGVRHTTVGRLEGAGFRVAAQPTARNPAHVVVEYPGVWNDEVSELFDRCFDAPSVWRDHE